MTTTETVETKANGAAEAKANATSKVPEQAAMVKVTGGGKGAALKEFRMVPLSKINILPDFNIDPKRMTDEQSLRRLAATIEASGGLLQPILVGAVEEKGETKLYLIAGHRRYAAYKMMGKKEIESFIRTFDSLGSLLANATENTGREAPHPFHLAKRIAFIRETHFAGDKEADSKLAEAFGFTKKHVQNLLRMYKNLSPKLRKLFESQSVTFEDASPPLKWLIEHSTEDHETQDAAYDLRFGEGAKDDEDEKPKKKGKKDTGDKPPRMRSRDDILWLKDKTLKPLTEKQIAAGHDVCFDIRKLGNEPKQVKISDRDRIIVREVLAWCLDKNRAEFLNVTEPEEVEEEDE